MESVLTALGGLLLRAVPTVLIFLFLHFYLKAVFFKPLEKALAERKAATEGVRRAAADALAEAERKAAEYEEALRKIRGQLAREQEELRKAWQDEQSAALAEARRQAEAMIVEARARVAQEGEAARLELRAEAERLAEEITRAMLARRAA